MYQRFGKRLLDVLISLIFLPLLALILLACAPFIYFEDRGPIFFVQKRRGRYGKPFDILKLRTMSPKAPDLRAADGSTLASNQDPRVTRSGRVLRRTSLDEVPQLLNVLKGDMSLVGPRPTLATADYAAYSAVKKKRLRVRPGITGYSQAYHRNAISAEEKFRLDALYVDSLSFRLDLKIILKTITSVLRRKDINND
ncbi:Undecaprenyl-phosphate galactosephosphotransferase [Clostridiaceae bacterium JG1575]|nr:Undecaprenyl-phosphate galactosephosphotransferase [Clostridiaceae bacterium JG1575]